MPELNFTPEQRAAIDTRGSTVLVSAAAGSGKTAVLTERVLTLITDPERPVDIDRLLIVTFSNAAAEEMRQRIAARLYERMEQEPENAVLRRQSLLLGNAEICTIHAFCYRLIRENFQALGLPGDMALGRDGEDELLQAAVLEQLPLLERYGFRCEDFGGAVLVREVPGDIDDPAGVLEELAEDLRLNRADPDAARDSLLSTMACKSAIKAGMHTDPAELRRLVDRVQSGEIQYCPHGRPVAVKLSKYQVEKMFKRA